jgi:hypothetical protein
MTHHRHHHDALTPVTAVAILLGATCAGSGASPITEAFALDTGTGGTATVAEFKPSELLLAESTALLDDCDIDCNTTGVPDDLELFIGTSLDCNSNGRPDECDLSAGISQDLNTNAVPDECELCGDLDGNGLVGLGDYQLLVAAAAACVGQPRFRPAADLDADGCVTIVDYQRWLQCYRTANGREFKLPRKPVPSPLLAPVPGSEVRPVVDD